MERPLDKLPEELREQHDRHMAQEPVRYRGFLIRPLSHRFAPYYTNRFHYWGYNVCLDTPVGGNITPGAVWFHSVGHAKTTIDVMHEVGFVTEIRYGHAWQNVADAERFWALMRERDEEQRAVQQERDALMVKVARLEGRFGLKVEPHEPG